MFNSLSTFDAFKSMPMVDGMIVLDDEQLKRLQIFLTGMWKDILSACEKNDINIMLCGGSCLGAVRHNGFIPWDDDMDLAMTRKDYNQLVRVFSEELGNEYILSEVCNTPTNGVAFAKISKKGTVLKTKDHFFAGDEAIGIDIFILDNVPNNKLLRVIHGYGSLVSGFLYSCRKFFAMRKVYYPMFKSINQLRVYYIKVVLGLFTAVLPLSAYIMIWDRWNGLCRNDKSRYLTIPTGRKHYFGECFRREVFFPVMRSLFEDVYSPIPRDADEYLTGLYGNYLNIPPECEREKHIYYEIKIPERPQS